MIHTPELNMVLYYTLLREWMHFGQTEFVIRSLSALFGIAAIPAVYRLGRRLFDVPTGLIAAALLATHSFHIRYSQEARAYSLQVFLLILCDLLFLLYFGCPESKEILACVHRARRSRCLLPRIRGARNGISLAGCRHAQGAQPGP